MYTYIAKIKDHQSIINEIYGEDSELVSIWNHDENKYVEL